MPPWFDAQTTLVVLLVFTATAYVVRSFYRAVLGRSEKGCGSCGSCPSASQSPTETAVGFVALDALSRPGAASTATRT